MEISGIGSQGMQAGHARQAAAQPAPEAAEATANATEQNASAQDTGGNIDVRA